jgi:hypothetical protein
LNSFFPKAKIIKVKITREAVIKVTVILVFSLLKFYDPILPNIISVASGAFLILMI